MDKHGHTIKKFLFAIILIVLMLPFVQQHVRFYESEPLNGFKNPAEKEYFALDLWWSGKYQEAYEGWHNENIGFRPELVRVYNQVAYSFYGEAKANGCVIGKDDYLYELNYINAYTGQDFIGYEKLKAKAVKLKELQDSLAAINKTLIVCFAPGKASFYPEYIPDVYKKVNDSTNNKIFGQLLTQYGVNLIDYNQWFVNMKGKAPYLLYPKTGVHWSRYGSTLAIDSLIKFVEKKRNIDMANIKWDEVIVSDSFRAPDDDIADAMNLYWPPCGLPMGYPQVYFDDVAGKTQPRMMAIGDSFFFSLLDVGIAPKSFSDITFSYYNAQLYYSDNSPMVVADIELSMEEADKADVIMLLATECTIWDIGWNFIEEAHDHFVAHKLVRSVAKIIAKYEAIIRADEKWVSDIKKKADAQGKTLDEMIYLDAKYMAEEEMKNSGQ